MPVREKRMPSVMGPQHHFSMVPQATIERSVFDRSSSHKTTFNAGLLIPVFVDEVLPGDTFHMDMTALVRLTTPLKPLMDNMYLESFFFFVPYRLVWSDWQKFCGEQVNPGDSTSFTVPQVVTVASGYTQGTLFDYFGLPMAGQVGAGNTVSHSALPLRAYNLIYNQWFRDENLINSVSVPVGDGPDSFGIFGASGNLPFKRGKRHDYFTSSLPFLQKGTAQVVALSGAATVKAQSAEVVTTGVNPALKFRRTDTNALFAGPFGAAVDASSQFYATTAAGGTATAGGYPSNLIADMASLPSPFTINALRQSFQIQKLLERDARGGTRYTEIVKAHFGVTSPDMRLQRPEYLGGGSSPVVVSPLPQLAQTGLTGGSTPQGNLAAYATGIARRHGFVKSFTEHGIIIGMVNVRADITYQQGLERMWSRSTRYDFYWPALAHIGEQAVFNREIYCHGDQDANDALVFGYQERYAEYRYKPSRISGKFRSTDATPLDIWHLSEKFSALPTLAQTFIEDQTHSILQRVVAVTTEPDFYGDFFFRLRCARPMPVFGVPGLIDHF